nr:glycoside hydrolase family 6 protein [Streptomyces sp. SID5468]
MCLAGALALGCAGPCPGGAARRAGDRLWVDPHTDARRTSRVWTERGREDDAELLGRMAAQPTAVWLGDRDPLERARAVTRAAALEGRVPVLVAYDIPHRDCGQYSRGGAPDGRAYRRWIRRLAAGVGVRRAIVVLEPDAVAQWVTGCPAAERDGESRLALLADAVRTLKALPATSVYLDAGNAGWVPDPARIAPALREAGVAEADGFALNVSNFQTTRVSRRYGRRLSRLLGGAHYVIDTSRNGRGPADGRGDGPAAGEEGWCNPPDRALGAAPTTDTGDPLIDAYLWIKVPGESDGACRGGPPAGQWWSEYALGLARAARHGGRRAASGGGGFSSRAASGPPTGFPGGR